MTPDEIADRADFLAQTLQAVIPQYGSGPNLSAKSGLTLAVLIRDLARITDGLVDRFDE